MATIWKPIEPLAVEDKEFGSLMDPIYSVWQKTKTKLTESSPIGLEEFNKRLVRRLSVETGILERLYDLDRGTTEALVAHGFVEDYVSRANTDIEPSSLIDILQDHESAILLVMDCVANNRPLSKSVIHELHVVLTRHQNSTTAIDPYGQRNEIELLKGKFKIFPNNPKRPDGSTHEYCPPEHVDTEIEKLINLLGQYEKDGVDPIVCVSWMHHRFTQIHPYQDGNGRVVRALSTLLLLKSELLPLVIDRDLRVEYITALEKADDGELGSLISMNARLEQNAIMQALSLDVDAQILHQQSVADAVLESLTQKFSKRKSQRSDEFKAVNNVAEKFRTISNTLLLSKFEELRSALVDFGNSQAKTLLGGPEEKNQHWYKYEVIQTAKRAGKFVNFSENHYFVKASIEVNNEQMDFVTSFHHVGRELNGMMEVTAFAKIDTSDTVVGNLKSHQEFVPCSGDPFIFTYSTDFEKMKSSFENWLDSALAIAFKEFGDNL